MNFFKRVVSNVNVVYRLRAMFNPRLPLIIEMKSIPPDSNPFHHDAYNMGCAVSGPWMAMFAEHAGHVQDLSTYPAGRKDEWYPDPEYIIMVNCRTGQRFKLYFPDSPQTFEARQREERRKLGVMSFETFKNLVFFSTVTLYMTAGIFLNLPAMHPYLFMITLLVEILLLNPVYAVLSRRLCNRAYDKLREPKNGNAAKS